MEQDLRMQIDYLLDLCSVTFIYNHVYCNAVSQCVNKSMKQDETFIDVANLKLF